MEIIFLDSNLLEFFIGNFDAGLVGIDV